MVRIDQVDLIKLIVIVMS